MSDLTLLQVLSKAVFFRQAYEKFGRPGRNEYSGLKGSARAYFTAGLAEASEGKVIYITANELSASRFADEFESFSDKKVILLNPLEYMLYDVEVRSSENSSERVNRLRQILSGQWDILVLPAVAAAQWLVEPEIILKSGLKIKKYDVMEPGELVQKLIETGYERTGQVDGKGQFSLRGDILDIYSYSEENPVRIEFYDTDVDSIRYFDLMTQRTVEDIEEFEISSCREIQIVNVKQAEKIISNIQAVLPQNESILKRVTSDIKKMTPGSRFPGLDRYTPFITEQKYSIFDYAPGAKVILDEPEEINNALLSTINDHVRICDTISQSVGLLPQTFNLYMTPSELNSLIKKKTDYITEFTELDGNCPSGKVILCNEAPDFKGDMEKFTEALEQLLEEGFTVTTFGGSWSKTDKLKELTGNICVKYRDKVFFRPGNIQAGFILPESKIAVLCDKAIFRKERQSSRKKLRGQAISGFADINPGDLVVHDIHGIGRFVGIESIEEEDKTRRDYIKIAYREDGILYVPTHQLSSVQKYIGPEASVPKLNKLGSAEWKNAKNKVKASLKVYARELVELYARRSKTPGFAFSKDSQWQEDFENAFEHEETEDQARCTEEIKEDMEKPIPMERLLCGDVGYGKTEVAIRAVFKAVCDGKQVAFLAPTTVLTLQHYNNFIKRFGDFPVKTEFLCRFKTPSQKRQILKDLASGKIDVIVGTHSLIKDGVKFSNLGLLVIDEEQRFGVMHKDKIKEKYPEIDILSLSATPIPRTLHMSLSGIRDISIIEDPPKNRQPVQTFVAEWNPEMIKNAIYRELGRKGQVFYLYNDVRGMDQKLFQLKQLVPQARIVVAHGQMEMSVLEEIMSDFLAREYDMLLCTTIIESGLDMPNVNTIIVENSDRLGLSQLYQIRGRVGRSDRQAYAYITYQKDKEIKEIADKRLKTIRDFTEFGSGFKIALRDLELRGAGSVLGEKQHGQLSAVGYDMYCKLLNNVLAEESGKRVEEETLISVEFRMDAYIGKDYISHEETRLDIYQKISRVEDEKDQEEMVDELIDRFGEVPQSVMTLIKVSRIKYLCSKLGFVAVVQKGDKVNFNLDANAAIYKVQELLGMLTRAGREIDGFSTKYRERIHFNNGKIPSLIFKTSGLVNNMSRMADVLLEFLVAIFSVKEEKNGDNTK